MSQVSHHTGLATSPHLHPFLSGRPASVATLQAPTRRGKSRFKCAVRFFSTRLTSLALSCTAKTENSLARVGTHGFHLSWQLQSAICGADINVSVFRSIVLEVRSEVIKRSLRFSLDSLAPWRGALVKDLMAWGTHRMYI